MEKNGSRRVSRALVMKEREKRSPRYVSSPGGDEKEKKKEEKKKKEKKHVLMARDASPTHLEPRAHLPFVDRTCLDVSCALLWPCHGRGMGKWGEMVSGARDAS
jgi:hypothetical protein